MPRIHTYDSSDSDAHFDDEFHDSIDFDFDPDVRPKTRSQNRLTRRDQEPENSIPKNCSSRHNNLQHRTSDASRENDLDQRLRPNARPFYPQTQFDLEMEPEFADYMYGTGRSDHFINEIGHQYESDGDFIDFDLKAHPHFEKARDTKGKLTHKSETESGPSHEPEFYSQPTHKVRCNGARQSKNDCGKQNRYYEPALPKGIDFSQNHRSCRSPVHFSDHIDSPRDHDDYRASVSRHRYIASSSNRTHHSYKTRTKQKDPKPFDGKKIEWVDYQKHFEAVAEWNEWSELQKARQLIMSFDGEAMKLLGELSDKMLSEYSSLVSEMNRRYDPIERAPAWRIEFRNRTRKLNETIMQYSQALKRLVIKAFPKMPCDAQEQWVLDQFNLGLGDVEMRKHIQFGHPQDVNAAVSLALEYEAFESRIEQL